MKKYIDYMKNHKIVTIVVAILLALCIWDAIDQPMFWQLTAVQNKRAIMNYVDEKYPGAKVIGYDFESTELFHTSLGQDSIEFEYNGVEFSVYGMYGKIHGDTYSRSKAEKYIDEKYIMPYLNQKDISVKYYQYIHGDITNNDLSTYKGSYTLRIVLNEMPEYFRTGEADWLYEFYLYWKEICIIPSYTVSFRYFPDNGGSNILNFTENSDFNSPEEFYAAFRYE